MEREGESMESVERDLVVRCIRGDPAAFRDLVERLEKPLLHFILRYVGNRAQAEDLFQETFVRVVRNVGGFEPQASLSTWVFTIARNLCLDALKMRRRHREVSLDAPQRDREGKVIDFSEVLRERASGPEIAADRRESEGRVMDALGRLAPAKREVLVLRVLVGMSYEEIANVVRAPIGTVKFRVHEAVRELSKGMKAEPEQDVEVG